jgi:hypothetical protein
VKRSAQPPIVWTVVAAAFKCSTGPAGLRSGEVAAWDAAKEEHADGVLDKRRNPKSHFIAI